MQLPLTLVNDGLLVGRHTVISFNRTLRIPEDGKRYNLPAGFGRLPILRVEDVADRVPEKWRQEGGLIIPLYQREALFLEFSGVTWRPVISKAAVGNINAITGKPHDLHLKAGRQDYVVIPIQKWLDGIYFSNNTVKQFVAMPLGQGYTIEAQVTDEEINGGFQLAVFEPKVGKFMEPRQEPWVKTVETQALNSQRVPRKDDVLYSQGTSARYSLPERNVEMGIAAGGSIKQQIFEDEYGITTWDKDSFLALNIHIVNSAVYEEITGQKAPTSPITAEEYAKRKLPWFAHYDETRRTVSAPKIFQKALSVFQIDAARGKTVGHKAPINSIPVIQIKTLTLAERVNELRESTSSCYRKRMFSECLNYSRLCGELIENHKYEIKFTKSSKSANEIAADYFCIASECSAKNNEMKFAEDFANRALNLAVSENALSCRLFARFQIGNLDGAQKDCEEILSLYPTNAIANNYLAIIAQKHSRGESNPDNHLTAELVDDLPSVNMGQPGTKKRPKSNATSIITEVAQSTNAAPQSPANENTYSSMAAVGFIAVSLLLILPFVLIIYLTPSRHSTPTLPANGLMPTPIVDLSKTEIPSKPVDPYPVYVPQEPESLPTITKSSTSDSNGDTEYTVVGLQSGDQLNVREGPGVRFPKVDRWENGISGIHVTGGPRNADQATWYKIERNGVAGWVNSQYLDPAPQTTSRTSYSSGTTQRNETTATVVWNGEMFTVRESARSGIEAKISAADAYVQKYSQLHAEHIALQEKLRKSGPLGIGRLTQQISAIEASMNRVEREGDRVIASMHALIKKSEVR